MDIKKHSVIKMVEDLAIRNLKLANDALQNGPVEKFAIYSHGAALLTALAAKIRDDM